MPTGQTIINNALTALGILEQGGTPSVSDSNDALAELNSQWDAWSIDEGFIWAEVAQRFPTAPNIGQYTVGPGGAMNIPQIPSRIYKAVWTTATGNAIATSSIEAGGVGYAVNDTGVVLGANGTQATYTVSSVDSNGAVTGASLNTPGGGYTPGYGFATAPAGGQPGTGSGFMLNVLTVTTGGTNRNVLRIVESSVYYGHHDLSAAAQVPEDVYPDYNPDQNGFARLYLWPVPNVAGTVELDTAVPFTQWTLTDTYIIPPGFQDPIQYALAWRLLPRFGMAVAQQVAEVIRELGQKSEARIMAANAFNRQKPMQAPQGQGAQSPITTAGASAFQGLQPKG